MLISLPEKVLRVGYCDHSQSGVRLSIPGLFKSSSEKTIFNETLHYVSQMVLIQIYLKNSIPFRTVVAMATNSRIF